MDIMSEASLIYPIFINQAYQSAIDSAPIVTLTYIGIMEDVDLNLNL